MLLIAALIGSDIIVKWFICVQLKIFDLYVFPHFDNVCTYIIEDIIMIPTCANIPSWFYAEWLLTEN